MHNAVITLHRFSRSTRPRARRRQGVILLVVLGTLILFSAVALTFVISARQFRGTAAASQSYERYDRGFDDLLHAAFLQLARGTNNGYSPLKPHSLLEDMYGLDGLPAPGAYYASGTIAYPIVTAASYVTSGGNNSGLMFVEIEDGSRMLKTINNYYDGTLFTVLDAPTRMQTTRIIAYNYVQGSDPPRGRFLLLGFKSNVLPAVGARVVINGRPFNGTGFGADGRDPANNPSYGSVTRSLGVDTNNDGTADFTVPYAFMPNAAQFVATPSSNNDLGYTDPSGPGGADEPYDAPDFDNMFLALRAWDRSRNAWVVVAPSFHRPELVNAFAKHTSAAISSLATANSPAGRAFRRKYILRPIPEPLAAGNPLTFDGGNPALTNNIHDLDIDNDGVLDIFDPDQAARGLRWDVDNDGDGLTDSIWVDLGFPVQKDDQGRLYKPLFAFLVLDMDGRLNLNTSGNVNQLRAASDPLNGNGPVGSTAPLPPELPGQLLATTIGGAVLQLPVGHGAGPHEVSLANVFDQASLTRLLQGMPGAVPAPAVVGRNGEFAGSGAPGVSDGARDVRDILRNRDFPDPGLIASGWPFVMLNTDNLWQPTMPTYFPTGWDGNEIIALGKGAHVLRARYNALSELEHPWHMNPFPLVTQRVNSFFSSATRPVGAPIDGPFNMAEMEAVLRMFDLDARSLASRIVRLAPTLTLVTTNSNQPVHNSAYGVPPINPYLRTGILTAESYETPVCSPLPTEELRQVLRNAPSWPTTVSGSMPTAAANLHILDLIRARILQANGSVTPQLADNTARRLLDPVLFQGLRMNINRPFGDHRDNNNNNVVDEPDYDMNGDNAPDGFGESGERCWWNNTGQIPQTYGPPTPGQYAQFANIPFDANNDGVFDRRDLIARQDHARHLFALLMLLKDSNYAFPVSEAMNQAQQQLYTAQRLAQWCVNVVDYYDRDSIMTGFEVDLEPYTDNDANAANGTWDVDGDLSTDETNNNVPRVVLWGCERQPLLLTEAIALHDCRTEDRDDAGMSDSYTIATNPMGMDDDFDQKRRPQPSLFFEMYNALLESVPAELRPSSGENAIDLSRFAPPGPGGIARPVWRVAITGPDTSLSNNPDTAHPPTYPTTAQAERLVWFSANPGIAAIEPKAHYTNLSAGSTNYENHVQWNSSNVNVVRPMYLVYPGQYSVVGPRVRTRIGRSGPGGAQTQNRTILLLDENAAGPQPPAGPTPDPGLPAGSLVSNTTTVTYPDWWTAGAEQIKRPMGIVINEPQPLSITGPFPDGTGAYPAPDATTPDPDDPSKSYADAYAVPFETPLDPPELQKPGFYRNRATLYLQRLANPLAPFDPDWNPYVTVDYMPVPLTVYNGETSLADPALMAVNPPNMQPGESFDTIERNGPNLNLWSQEFSQPNARNRIDFRHSLGFLNDDFTAAGGGRLNAGNAQHPNYIGQPAAGAWPWITWNDRPFNNALELLHVPASAPSRLFWEFSIRNGATERDHYLAYGRPGAMPGAGPARHPYHHLLNFFNSSTADYATAGANLHRVFEFLTVPSRFDGTEEILPPGPLVGNTLSVAGLGSIQHALHPPFNRVSNFREPGKVNLNTLFDDGTTFASLLNNFNDYNACINLWRNSVWPSRQGFGSYNNGLPLMNPAVPTFLANPFRSFNNSFNVPIPPLASRQSGQPRHLSDGTLFRVHPAHEMLSAGDPRRPLLASETYNTTDAAPYLGFGRAQFAHNDGDRNPYFRYQALQTLGGKVTNRSSVFAVWITVGYFECYPATDVLSANNNNAMPRSLSPDSVVLGQELGSDTGDIVRHRAFYVFDRSLPVGFVRGEDLNAENAILVKRIIE